MLNKYEIFPGLPESTMIEVEGGSFQLANRIPCEVSAFYLAQYAVSQGLWGKVMRGNPASFKGDSLPIETISWYKCVEFCNKLSELTDLDPVYTIDKRTKDPNNERNFDDLRWLVSWNPQANGYRLPTEAEWEYAARGGKYAKKSLYAGSEVLKEVGWFGKYGKEKRMHGQTEVLGLCIPNELGLHDMSGNVREWCWDWRGAYSKGPLKDPKGPNSGSSRVLRGGSWILDADYCRVARRYDVSPDGRGSFVGLRLARTVL